MKIEIFQKKILKIDFFGIVEKGARGSQSMSGTVVGAGLGPLEALFDKFKKIDVFEINSAFNLIRHVCIFRTWFIIKYRISVGWKTERKTLPRSLMG